MGGDNGDSCFVCLVKFLTQRNRHKQNIFVSFLGSHLD